MGGYRFREFREAAGLSQAEVAAKLGVTTSRYGSWEREDREPNIVDVAKIADIYGCTLDALVGRNSPTKEDKPDPAFEAIESAYRSMNADGRAALELTARGLASIPENGAGGIAVSSTA